MPTASFCSAAGKGLQSCSRPGRSDSYCSRKSAELLSCRNGGKGSSGGKGSGSKGKGKGSGSKGGKGKGIKDQEWYELETPGYFILYDDALDGHFIRDPNGVIHFVANEDQEQMEMEMEETSGGCSCDGEKEDPGYFDPITGEPIGTILEEPDASSTNCCACSCSHTHD
jgi:hypothetical protein